MAEHTHNTHRSVVKRRRPKESASAIARQNLTAAERLVKKSGDRLNIAEALRRIVEVRKERRARIKKKGG